MTAGLGRGVRAFPVRANMPCLPVYWYCWQSVWPLALHANG